MPTLPPSVSQSSIDVSPIYVNPHYCVPSVDESIPEKRHTQLPILDEYLRKILTAKVYDVAVETALTPAPLLSSKLGNRPIFLKREDTQPVHSFKIRGAYNKLRGLSQADKNRGVIACSAGNHAQGIAIAARALGIDAVIVMPAGSAEIKWKSVQRLGAKVILHGADLFESKTECLRLAAIDGKVFVHPYDDPDIIAGQGTVAVEILKQIEGAINKFEKSKNSQKTSIGAIDEAHHRSSGSILGMSADVNDLEAIFVPIGGGGLCAGVAAYVKALYPGIKIVGVNCYDSDSMRQALIKGEPLILDYVNAFADGTAVREAGKHTFEVLKSCLDEIVLVSTDEISAAIKDVFMECRSVLEPAGAMSVAGMKRWCALQKSTESLDTNKDTSNKALVAVLSGANMNFDRLRFVAERAEIGEEREALIAVTMPEIPGTFYNLFKCIIPRQVTGISYRYRGHRGHDDVLSPLEAQEAHVVVSFAVQDRDREIGEIFDNLKQQGMQAMDLSFSEIAKTHLRHLVGGRTDLEHERLISFSFPERPKALYQFLTSLTQNPNSGPFNITLLNYRNYGGDVGRVLVGIECPPEKHDDLDKFLETLTLPWRDESDSEVYRWFLKWRGDS